MLELHIFEIFLELKKRFNAPCTLTVLHVDATPKIKTWTLISCDTLCKPPNKTAQSASDSVSKSRKWLRVCVCADGFLVTCNMLSLCNHSRGSSNTRSVCTAVITEHQESESRCHLGPSGVATLGRLHFVWQRSNVSEETRLQPHNVASLPWHTEKWSERPVIKAYYYLPLRNNIWKDQRSC